MKKEKEHLSECQTRCLMRSPCIHEDSPTMSAEEPINVRVDSELKKSAEELFNDLGLNMSTAITMFLKSAVSHNGIPFEVKRVEPNAETIAALKEYDDMKKNPGSYKRYHSFQEIMDDLNGKS